MSLTGDIIAILDEIRNGMYKYQKLLKSMRTLCDKHGLKTFFDAFFTPFSNVLLVYKREPAVERVIEFVSKFAIAVSAEVEEKNESSSRDEDDDAEASFANLIMAKLVVYHEAKDKAVRFRVCQIINKILLLAAQEQVRISCLDLLQAVMLQRAYDKIPAVRVQAVQALSRFQDPEDKECPVIAVLLNVLRGDGSADVRKSALHCIVICNRTLPAIIECVHDVKDSIRQATFLILAEKCSIMNLTIAQRLHLLEAGLNDRSDVVQDACGTGLLRSWCLFLEGDFLRLLRRLDAENSPEIAEKAVFKLFDNLYSSESPIKTLNEFLEETQPGHDVEAIGEGSTTSPGVSTGETADEASTEQVCQLGNVRLLRFSSLNCEMAFFWRCMCRYYSKKGLEGERQLEKIVPTLSEFCDYVQKYVVEVFLEQEEMNSRLQSQFVAQQLFSMFEVLDFADDFGRRRLAKLVYDLTTMPNFPPGLVAPLLARQADIWPQETYRIEKLTELIADLRQPPIEEGCEGRQHQPLAPESTQMSESQFINSSQLDLRSDSTTLIKCLVVAAEMLREIKMKKLNPTLLTLLDMLVLPCVQNENPFVRDLALNCLGLACILEVSLAQKHLLLFLQVSQVDHESVQATALKIVFDLVHLFGFEAYATHDDQGGDSQDGVLDNHPLDRDVNPEEPVEEMISKFDDLESKNHNKTTQKMVNILADFLDGESQLLCSIAAEGLAKLFLSGRIMSQKLLARLLLLWYSPDCEEDKHLRGVLGVFFPTFAASKRSYRESLGEIFTVVLEAVLEAEPGSMYAGINTSNVVDFLLHLTKPVQDEDSVHDSLAIAVANKVLADPANVVTARLYCRALSLMEFTPTNKSGAADLQVLLGQLEQLVADKTSLRYVKKAEASLQKINPIQALQASTGRDSPEAEGTEPLSGEQENVPVPVEPLASGVAKEVKKPARKRKGKAPLASRQEVETLEVVVTTQQACEPKLQEPSIGPRGSKVRQQAPKTVAAKKTAKGKGKGKSEKPAPAEDNLKDTEVEQPELCEELLIPTPPTVVRNMRKGKKVKGKSLDGQLFSPENPAADKKVSGRGMKQQVASEDDESDDSLLGEHSPFVKQTIRTRQVAPPPIFDCSDQET